MKYFKPYLYRRHFLLRTDHGSLRWLCNFKEPEGQLARWMETLAPYHMDIQHRPGQRHRNADALSRLPCKQCGIYAGWEEQKSHNVATICAQGNPISQKQDEDVDVKLVKSWIENGKRPYYREIANRSRFVKSLWNVGPERGTLYRKFLQEDESVIQQEIVPMTMRKEIFKNLHDGPVGGHLGIRKTLDKIRAKYYWPGLHMDVALYVGNCKDCNMRKQPAKLLRAPTQLVQVGEPLQRVAIDIMGPLPVTKKGNKYIVVIVDYYTKWTQAVPTRNIETIRIVNALIREFISKFGIPASIHSDQGTQFESDIFQEMCRVLNIEKMRTSPYHPQCDGLVERFNRTLEDMLAKYVRDNHSEWDLYLSYVMMAYRSAVQETTGFSPNMMMLGREVSTPIDIQYPIPGDEMSPNLWVEELRSRMQRSHQLVRETVTGNMNRQKHLHDEKTTQHHFKKGDKAYVFFPRTPYGGTTKFNSCWRGPYCVLEKVGPVDYRVNCGHSGSPQVVHINRLKPCLEQFLLDEERMDPNNGNVDDEPTGSTENISPREVENNEGYRVEGLVEKQDTGVLQTEFDQGSQRPQQDRRQPKYLEDYDCAL